MKPFSIIVAVSTNNGIGKNGKLPWKNKEDMQFFKNKTCKVEDPLKQNVVIMGRHTFESLGMNPLPNRKNIVITSHKYESVSTMPSLTMALKSLDTDDLIERIFIIGGERLYNEAINHPSCHNLYVNYINLDVECDTFFPEIDMNKFTQIHEINISPIVKTVIYFTLFNV